MQFSLAQHVTEAFQESATIGCRGSIRGIRIIGAVVPGDEAHQFEKLIYVSDWLHLWNLIGDAAAETGGDYGLYMQVVALSFADMDALSPTVEHAIPPAFSDRDESPGKSDSAGAEDEFVTSQGYALPSSMLPEMYQYCKELDDDTRVRLVRSFLEEPARFRSNFLA